MPLLNEVACYFSKYRLGVSHLRLFFYDCKCGVILTCCLLTSEDHKGQYLLARSDFVSQITKLTIDIPTILAELISLEKMKAS